MSDRGGDLQVRGSASVDIRDIRRDLGERAKFLQREIFAADRDYGNGVANAKRELHARLSALHVAMLVEEYRSFLKDFLDSDRMR